MDIDAELVNAQIRLKLAGDRVGDVHAQGGRVYETDGLTIHVEASEDGVQITLEPADPETWDVPLFVEVSA